VHRIKNLLKLRNDYLIGSKNFIILEVATFSLCHSMFLFFFLEIYFEAPKEKTTFKTRMSAQTKEM
jgi:hypothetical protein